MANAATIVDLILASRPKEPGRKDRRRKLAAEWLGHVDRAMRDRSDETIGKMLDGLDALVSRGDADEDEG